MTLTPIRPGTWSKHTLIHRLWNGWHNDSNPFLAMPLYQALVDADLAIHRLWEGLTRRRS